MGGVKGAKRAAPGEVIWFVRFFVRRSRQVSWEADMTFLWQMGEDLTDTGIRRIVRYGRCVCDRVSEYMLNHG